MKTTVVISMIVVASICWILSYAQKSGGRAKTLKVGDKIPNITLRDQDGHDFNLRDQAGKHKLVIFFYPKDESPVCTKEACAFRDNYQAFERAGALIVGINPGSVAEHKAFTEHYKLPFILLSDAQQQAIEAFGVRKAMFLNGRETFVVDQSGKIIFKYRDMLKGAAHAEKALEALKNAR